MSTGANVRQDGCNGRVSNDVQRAMPHPDRRSRTACGLTVSALLLFPFVLHAESLLDHAPASAAVLPDSPGFSSSADGIPFLHSRATAAPPQIAPRSRFNIDAGQPAQPLSARDKLRLGTQHAREPGAFVDALTSAGIDHLTDSRPHFGTDSAGYGERLGATVYRSDVKALFGYGIFPALFRTDPRFYVLGDRVPFKQRALYAATRIVVARKDNGAHAINYSRLLAPVISQGSANGFYPSQDQDVGKTVTGILTSYGASAGADELKEFKDDLLRFFHLSH